MIKIIIKYNQQGEIIITNSVTNKIITCQNKELKAIDVYNLLEYKEYNEYEIEQAEQDNTLKIINEIFTQIIYELSKMQKEEK